MSTDLSNSQIYVLVVCTKVYGRECNAGQELGNDGQLHWVINEDPDGCTDLRMAGGLNMQRRVNPHVKKSGPEVTTQIPRGEPNKGHVCEYFTAPSNPHTFRYIMGPLSMPFKLDFEAKTYAEALIALAERNATDSMFAEINIGGWSGNKSVIRPCHSDICPGWFGEHNEPGIVNENEFRPFWIEYIEGVVKVGKGGQQTAFSQLDAGAYHGRVIAEVYVGISGWRNFPSYWVFNTPYVCK
ncbi:uncharacterized protein [Asterias amurensis]|uniref:uncharacterized protein n=1 Tax=Asterias amurensis TaxID=7602 RepID=UPI003AB3D3CF